MFRKANNVFSVILNDVNVASTALPAVGTVITNANLPAGAVVLCDMGMRRMDNTAYAAMPATGMYFVVQGKGANQPLMKSPAITKGSTTFSIAKHKAAVQQVTYVGYTLLQVRFLQQTALTSGLKSASVITMQLTAHNL